MRSRAAATKKTSPAVGRFRDRQRRTGFTRLEVKARLGDVPLVRGLASALAEGAAPDSSLRTELEAVLAKHVQSDFKDLLREAPFDDTDIPRDRDPGRDVEL
jgi:hypothetical protein